MIRFSKTWTIVLILAILLPVWVFWIAPSDWDAVLIYPLSTAFLAALVIAMIAGGNKFSYMHLFFWIFVYIMFGISALAQVSQNSWPWPGYYSTDQISRAYGIIWIGLMIYEIAYHFRKKQKLDNKISEITNNIDPQKDQGSPGIKLAVLSVFLAIITYGYLISQDIPIITLRDDYSTLLLDAYGTIGYAFVLFLTQSLPLITFLWIISEYKSHPSNKSSRILYFLVGIMLTGVLIISSNPIVAPRWWFSTVFIAILLVGWGKSKRILFLLGLGIPLIYILLFPYLDLFRTYDTFERIMSSSRSGYLENLLEGDFDSLQQIMNTQVYVKYQGITYGRQLLGVIAYWIPRGLWINKPLDTGVMVAEYLSYPYTNLSSPLWAEGLINFGILGVFLFLAFWGYVSGMLDNVYQFYSVAFQPYPVFLLPLFYMLVPAQHFLIRGSLLVATLFISSPILVSLVWSWINRINRYMTRPKYLKSDLRANNGNLPQER